MQISWVEMLLVGIFEEPLAVLMALILCKGNDIFRVKGSQVLYFILKLLLSSIIILVLMFFIRTTLVYMVFTSGVCTIVFLLVLRYLWGFNVRQSLISGCITAFTLAILDFAPLPILFLFMEFEDILQHKVWIGSCVRIIHAIIIVVMIKFRFNLSKVNLLSKDWKELTPAAQRTAILIICLIFICITFVGNYADVFFKLGAYGNVVSMNIHVFFIGTLIIMCIAIALLSRTYYFEMCRDILNLDMLQEINDFRRLKADNFIRFIAYMQKKHKTLKSVEIGDRLKDFDEMDYTFIAQLIAFIMCFEPFRDSSVDLAVSIDQDAVVCNVCIESDELSFRKLMMQAGYQKVKNDLIVNSRARLDAKYKEGKAVFSISQPVRRDLNVTTEV
ncbi:MAG: hypothetical protein MJB12_18225 [Firmicutes bacterium]|nr:hypothetical protein [Bacillota bacterium]